MKYACVFIAALALGAGGASTIDKDARVGFESISTADLKTYLTYLTSDSLQGRETSYPGERLAAGYIAQHFKASGLKPVGDNGTYLQHYDVDLMTVSDASTLTVTTEAGTKTFSWIKDFVAFGARDTSLRGEVAFVGYADNRTPDAERAKLKGKVVVTFAGSLRGAGPAGRAQMARRFFGGGRRDSGAVASLIVLDDTGATSYAQVLSQLGSAGLTRGRMVLKGEPPRQGRPGSPSYLISPSTAAAILAPSGMTVDQLRAKAAADSTFSPIVLNVEKVVITTAVIREQRQAENVVGLLEGSDPAMKNDVVVFSAHFDHLGVGANGAIYHGADDDGSGTAMVMELAHAFAANPVKPKCSLLFLTVSGEEKGLLGSAYYTSHPIIPLERTVADFNTDMIGRMDTLHEKKGDGPYTYLIGSDKISTELDSILQVANRESNNIVFDYRYNDEHDPNQFYRRSDHFNFARHGVPIAFFFTGDHADYHKPTDTIDKILFDRMVKIGQVVYYAGWKTANVTHLLPKNGTGSGYTTAAPTVPAP